MHQTSKDSSRQLKQAAQSSESTSPRVDVSRFLPPLPDDGVGQSELISVEEHEGDQVLEILDQMLSEKRRDLDAAVSAVNEGLEREPSRRSAAALQSKALDAWEQMQMADRYERCVDQLCDNKLSADLVQFVREETSQRNWLERTGDPSFHAAGRYIDLARRSVDEILPFLDRRAAQLALEILSRSKSDISIKWGHPDLLKLGQLEQVRQQMDEREVSHANYPFLAEALSVEANLEQLPAGEAGKPFVVDRDRIEAFAAEINPEVLPETRYELRIRMSEWIVKEFTRSLVNSERIHEAIDYFHELCSELQKLTGLEVRPRNELDTFELDPVEIRDPSRVIYQVRHSMSPFACQPKQIDLAEVVSGGDMVSTRRLDPSSPAERLILENVAGAYLEEFIHSIQFARMALGSNARFDPAKGETELLLECSTPSIQQTEEQDGSMITSSLTWRFLMASGRELGSFTGSEVAEIDVLGRLIELYQEEGIPLTRARLECFVFHFEKRHEFVAWAIDEGIIPQEIVPDWFTDLREREARVEFARNESQGTSRAISHVREHLQS